MFQFQTGAIKRFRTLRIKVGIQKGFNSKLVRLKEGDGHQLHLSAITRFNSKLVRLKGWGDESWGCTDWFQFQTGAIKSGGFR